MFIFNKKRLTSALATLLLVGVQTFAPIAAIVPKAGATPVQATCTNDVQGANDEPGQKDLTRFCNFTGDVAGKLTISWNWDETAWAGGNTGDGCALFDTNNNGKVDYAVCVTIGGDPAHQLTQSPRVYSCTDGDIDNCTGAAQITPIQTSCTVSITSTDPFNGSGKNKGASYPNDTTAACTVTLSEVGGNSAHLKDVCSYPSQQPTSDPSDCVVTPTQHTPTATIQIKKILVPANDPGVFNLNIGSTTYATTNVSLQTDPIEVTPGSGFVVNETAVAGTNLGDYTTSISCLNGNDIVTGTTDTLSTTARSITISVADGDTVVCAFTNTRQTGTLQVVKDVINDNGGTKTYADFHFSVNGGTAQSFDVTTSPDGAKSVTVPTGTYTVTEPEANTMGYATSYSDSCANAVVVAGQTTTCTITNDDQPGTLVVKKIVTNDNGGTKTADKFSFSVNSGTPQSFEADGQNNLTVNAGAYSVTETADSEYTPAYDNCSNLAIPNGGTATCTITNDDKAPSLTLVKEVENNYGGKAVATDWTLTATGPSTISGAGGATSDSTFKAGTYTLSESGNVSGYQAGSWSCTNGVTIANSQITLANGQTTTCTITNSAIQPLLTIVKQVLDPYGTALLPSQFPLFVDSTQVVSGAANGFNVGTYTISETQQPGYTFKIATGDCTTDNGVIRVILGLGDKKTCTLTNTAIQPKLIVIKHVVNNYGGTEQAGNFTMTVSGNSMKVPNFAGDEQGTTVYLNEGSYSVDELSHDGYTETLSNDCSGTIAIGETKTCTVTNSDMPASLTVVKVAVPSTTQSFAFTSKELGNFSLTGDNTATSAKTFDNLNSGTYTLSEQSTDNWQTVYMECRPTDGNNYSISNNNLSVTLNNGDDVTCYVYNLELNTISGHKFNDVNNNHVWDNGEPTLKNWTITLTGCVNNGDDVASVLCTNQVNRTTTTDTSGAYSFTGLEPGTYKVCEVQQANWTQTYPQDNNGCHEVTIDVEQYGEVFTADFGNHPNPQVLGSSTTKLLVNTGMDASRNVIVGLIILGLLGSIHFLGARKKYNA